MRERYNSACKRRKQTTSGFVFDFRKKRNISEIVFIIRVGAFVGCIFGALFILVDSPLLALWFVVLFLVLQMALYYFGMNRAYAVYAVAYDALMEQLPQPELPTQM